MNAVGDADAPVGGAGKVQAGGLLQGAVDLLQAGKGTDGFRRRFRSGWDRSEKRAPLKPSCRQAGVRLQEPVRQCHSEALAEESRICNTLIS